ncbi:MAG: hypothetical protein R3F59_17845 [Myxococcota bacterium]
MHRAVRALGHAALAEAPGPDLTLHLDADALTVDAHRTLPCDDPTARTCPREPLAGILVVAETTRRLDDHGTATIRYRDLPATELAALRDAVVVQVTLPSGDPVLHRLTEPERRTLAALRPPAPTRSCCKTCSTGKACGNSCISRAYQCHQPPGCACDAD